MRTSVNLALQLTAIIVATALRFTQPGWLVVIFVIYGIGPALLLAQVVLAAVAMGRPRIPGSVAAPFVIAAASLVTANLLIADMGDGPRLHSPLELVTGFLPDALQSAGWFLMVVWIASLGWALVALCVTWPRQRVLPPPAYAMPGPAAP
ncbi:MAG: hypothetical protein L0H84_03195 [Pseudonocardia sp.]|nr:hypothetical protein [Pseudonocardia sp.]